MSWNRRRINRLLARLMLALGIVFLLYVAALYCYYYFGYWHQP
jgi:hypothetical protein